MRGRMMEAGAGATVAALAVALFHFHGVTDMGYDPATATRSLFVWIAARWMAYSTHGNDFPCGWIGPLGCAAMLFHLRHELAAAPRRTNWTGLGLILFALLLHWAGARAQQTRISIAAFLLLAWAVPLHVYGWPVARRLIAPIGFLVFALQFDFLGGIATRMRTVAATVSAVLLEGLGKPAAAAATSVVVPGRPAIDLALAPGGLRSLMWLAAAAYLAAWWRLPGLPRKLALLACVPLAGFVAMTGHAIVRGMTSGGFATQPILYYAPALALLAVAFRILATVRRPA